MARSKNTKPCSAASAFTFSLALVVSLLLWADISFASGHPSVRVAERFLVQLDEGGYAQAWDATSTLFKQRVGRQTWLDDVVHLRSQYGRLITRQLQFSKVVDAPPDAPRQTFLYLLFRSEFSVKGAVVEGVTMMIDQDRSWRVAGYDIE